MTLRTSTVAKAVPALDQSPEAHAFRRWGYLLADLEPFGRLPRMTHRDLEGLVEKKELQHFRSAYCGELGAEFMHILATDRTDWIASRLEGPQADVDKKFLLERVLRAELFEKFIHTRYVGSKRFSLEGLAALIPLFDSVLEQAGERGFETVIVGMAHRGRLTAMWTVFQSAAQNIFSCFEDVDPESVFGSGDVKYHRGATGIYKTKTGKELRVHLASNPSHLEAVNPVIMGRVRAKQDRSGDTERAKTLAVIVHGDAAFAGQGITAESLSLADMPGYTCGGTIHIVANNLVGFTAPSTSCHSTPFSTDAAKRLPIPIFHVNAESPETVSRIGAIAMDYRADFKSDVIIDLIGYRRFGHNEGDDPTFTLPVLYQKIEKHPYLYQLYADKLGINAEELQQMESAVNEFLTAERDAAQTQKKQPSFFTRADYWKPYVGGQWNPEYDVETKISADVVAQLTTALSQAKPGFNVHPKMQRLLDQRREMGEGKRAIDYGMAETLAYGSLLVEGVPVRITGQDSRRGTFSHRQSVLVDVVTGEDFYPLNHIAPKQAPYTVFDSILSEAAVMGFEYGFSRDYPEALVCWEAQFGDFVNGAQIIIDQFLTAAEDKWGLLSSLVLLLPHGYEGGGPEHSSARLERFLQLCGEDNIQVAQPSTAAQHFHLLRRQGLLKWKKPLIVMTPKSALRLPAATSNISEITQGRFHTVLADDPKFNRAEKVLLCTGKLAHELRAERDKRATLDTAVVTLEQLYPFPEEELAAVIDQYQECKQVVWVQEEPANMGALFFVRPYLDQLPDKKISTVRRLASASPATGSAKAHELEQKAIINMAFANRPAERK